MYPIWKVGSQMKTARKDLVREEHWLAGVEQCSGEFAQSGRAVYKYCNWIVCLCMDIVGLEIYHNRLDPSVSRVTRSQDTKGGTVYLPLPPPPSFHLPPFFSIMFPPFSLLPGLPQSRVVGKIRRFSNRWPFLYYLFYFQLFPLVLREDPFHFQYLSKSYPSLSLINLSSEDGEEKTFPAMTGCEINRLLTLKYKRWRICVWLVHLLSMLNFKNNSGLTLQHLYVTNDNIYYSLLDLPGGKCLVKHLSGFISSTCSMLTTDLWGKELQTRTESPEL